MGRLFVMGDVHGAYRALRQCLDRSDFNYEKDQLIFLGDICDGWPDTSLCIDELLKVKHLTFILGNHDWWMLKWMQTGAIQNIWYNQGGMATITSYKNEVVPDDHIHLIESALPYTIIDQRLFVHAGIDRNTDITKQTTDTFLWDRELATTALQYYEAEPPVRLTSFDEVYIGHTPVAGGKPINACEVWLMDTGAGWSGVLSMMNVNTKEVFSSDPVPSLYPGITGRKRRLSM